VSLHEKVLAARRKRTPGPEPDMSVDPEERARRDARNHKIRERRRADRGETDDPLEGLTAEVVEEVVRRARERLGLGE
jgi:ribosome-binding protein aMBF1 (putative translation factor)